MTNIPLYLDILGHIGYILIVVGMLLLARKRRPGWLFRVAGGAIWLYVGVMMSMSSIIRWSGVFLLIDYHGYLKWR